MTCRGGRWPSVSHQRSIIGPPSLLVQTYSAVSLIFMSVFLAFIGYIYLYFKYSFAFCTSFFSYYRKLRIARAVQITAVSWQIISICLCLTMNSNKIWWHCLQILPSASGILCESVVQTFWPSLASSRVSGRLVSIPRGGCRPAFQPLQCVIPPPPPLRCCCLGLRAFPP